MPTQDSRIRIKRSTVAGVTPTIPASNNHLDGSWVSTDLYIGEFMTNVVDNKVWFRASGGIVQIPTTLSGLYALLTGDNSFVGDQTITGNILTIGTLTASGIKDTTLIASKIMLTSGIKQHISSAYTETDLANAVAIQSGWSAQVFSAGNYSAPSGGTWTVSSGDVINNRYKLIGKTLIWNVRVETSTIASTPGILRVALPNGYVLATSASSIITGFCSQGGTREVVVLNCVGGNAYVNIDKLSGSAFSNSTDATEISFQVITEIN